MVDSTALGLRRALGLYLLCVGLLAGLASRPLAAQLVCNGPAEGFGPGLPASWAVVDNAGSGLRWRHLGNCGEAANFTGGQGAAACVSSDKFGPAPFGTSLRSPLLDLTGVATAELRFLANYQNFSASDRLDVDVSTNGGATWSNGLGWSDDRGAFRAADGVSATVDLSPVAGANGVLARWRYHDPEGGAFGWYAQIDEVRLRCDLPACDTPPAMGLVADGGFAGGGGWVASSVNFPTPICTPASCGFDGARSAGGWAFFGGTVGAAEVGALEQSLNLPLGIATLSFYLWIPEGSGNGSDHLRLLVDGTEVFRAGEAEDAYRDGYRHVKADVSAFADGGAHTLRVEGVTSGAPGNSNFFVDDMDIEVCTSVVSNPTIVIDGVTLDEGNVGLTEARFPVTLSGAAKDPVTVTYATSDITAMAGDDYDAASGTLTFLPGEKQKEIVVSVRGDTVDEPTEAFTVTLSAPVNGTLGTAAAVGTIVNDDFAFLSVTDAAVVEGDSGTTAMTFSINLSGESSQTVTVSYATVDVTAAAGADYMATAGAVSLAPGTLSQQVQVLVNGDELVERDERFVLELSGPLNAAIDRDRGSGLIVDDDRGRFPIQGTDVLYTETPDFELANLLNVTAEEVPDTLRLTRVKTTFANLWVAASGRGTVVRIDTRTGQILGEYATNPDAGSAASPNPSRTTVALDGSVWAGNRNDGSVIHVGLPGQGQCVDRNGNGTIETSAGYGDVLAWPNPGGVDSTGGVTTAVDECILHYVKVSAAGTRHLSIDGDNNVWVSGLFGAGAAIFDLVDGATGAILRTEGPFACGGYGGLVDRNGVVWSARYNGPVLRFDPAVSPPTSTSARCIGGVASYGLALDGAGSVWVAGPSGDRVWKVSSDGDTVEGPFAHGSAAAQGLAADARGDVWVSSAKWSNTSTVGHLLNDGTFIGNVTGVPLGSSGVAVDRDGKIWVANATSSSAARIDPTLGPIGADGVTRIGQVDLVVPLPGASPYNYSDMTGSLVLANTSPRGTWQVTQDAGAAGAAWGAISWNTEAEGEVPPGTSLLVEAKAADAVAALGTVPFVAVDNDVPFSLPGRYIQVRVTLAPDAADVTPVLSDIRIRLADPTGGQRGISIGNSSVIETDTGSQPSTFTVELTDPSDGTVQVAYTTRDASATAGADYLAASGVLSFAAGESSRTIDVDVLGDRDSEEDEIYFLELSAPVGGVITDGLGVGVIIDNDSRLTPVEARSKIYTFDADFDLGSLFNVNHDAPGSDQLQVSDQITTFPFIWIAGSGKGTLYKIDTRTGAVLGEYSTSPDVGVPSNSNPSRTTVGLDGSVWAGNRSDASAIHIGLLEEGQCIDRNGNGVIETSTGIGDILPWPNTGGVDTDGGVETAFDECVLHYTRLPFTGPRHVSVDANGDVWVSATFGNNDRRFVLIDGKTGEIKRDEGPFACGGYGGLVDSEGIVWSVRWRGGILRWDPSVDPPTSESLKCVGVGTLFSYGIAIGPEGNIFVTRESGNRMWRIDKDDLSITTFFNHGTNCSQGLAVDNNSSIWVSSSRFCSVTARIGHVKTDGTFIGTVSGPSSIRGTTGIAVDAAGKVWGAASQGNSAFRVDPTKGPIGADGVTPTGEVDLIVSLPGSAPYNYSDMTGATAFRNTAPRGTWRVIQDSGTAGTEWGTVIWNTEPAASVPAGASVQVEVRAADTVGGLGGRLFLPVTSGEAFSAAGRYLEVRVTLRPSPTGVTPVLSDLEIRDGSLGDPEISVNDVTVSEADAGTVAAEFEVVLSGPSDREIRVSYATVDGSAKAGQDYVAASGTLVYPPGTTRLVVPIEILDDAVAEPDETFNLRLEFPRRARIADGQGVGTITDDDPAAEIAIADVAVVEGNSGTVAAEFVITLTGNIETAVRVDYATLPGTATPMVDYQPISGYLVLEPGTTQVILPVLVVGDIDLEENETFFMELVSIDAAILTDPLGVGTIIDDDLLELSIGDVEVVEGADGETTDALFELTLTIPAPLEITIDYATADDTATAGADYQAAAGTLTIPAGATSATIPVTVLGDGLLEDDETFTVELSNPVNSRILDGLGVGTILDDERCPGPNLLANPGAEEDLLCRELPGWTPVVGAGWQARYADPDPFAGQAYFWAGEGDLAELRQDVDAAAYADWIAGGDQAFRFSGRVRTFDEVPGDTARIVVEYRDGTNTVVLDAWDTGEISSPAAWLEVADERAAPVGTGWIRLRLLATRLGAPPELDGYFDELSLVSLRRPVVTVGDAAVLEGDSGTVEAVFALALSCPLEVELVFTAETADGTALAGEDYQALPATPLGFAAGETELSLPITVFGDLDEEADETFLLLLSGAPAAALVDAEGEGTILDDDTPPFCQRSPGYWKNHTEAWPVTTLRLGCIDYDAAGLLAVLRYGGPDASSRLAHHLAATKLNLAAGSEPSILPVVEEADVFLAAWPPGSDPRGDARREANRLKDLLDEYNNAPCDDDQDSDSASDSDSD